MFRTVAIPLLVFVALSLVPQTARSELYLRPIFGYMFPVDGEDSSATVGGALGYTILERFAIEASYTRMFGTGASPDSNIYELSGAASIYLPILTPFIKLGAGAYKVSAPNSDYNAFFETGLGAYLNVIPIFDIGAGLSYMIFINGEDFIYPYLYAGISF